MINLLKRCKKIVGAAALGLCCILPGCMSEDEEVVAGSGWIVDIPEHFPVPNVPEDNPMTQAKVELGRHLFYTQKLSGNEQQACASCHIQEHAFTDTRETPVGSTGDHVPRNALHLANAAYHSVYTWANPNLDTLERQIAVPIFNEFPVELGATGKEDEIIERFRNDPLFAELFTEAFPEDDDPFTMRRAIDALATFVRSLVSADSPYDQFLEGDNEALTSSEIRGMELFFSERLECHHCHGGFNFTFSTDHENSGVRSVAYHNTGLYNLDGAGAYPIENTGLHEITGNPDDMGSFRAPSLRNVEVTAPYMHDGSVATLEEVIRIYEAGGRNIESGPNAGDGRASPHKSGLVKGFVLTDEERQDLINFLHSLTDETFLTNPQYAKPSGVE